MGRRAVQVCRLRARSLPVPPILYFLGPETPEGPKGQRTPNTSRKPPAPPGRPQWAGETPCSGRQHGAPWKDGNQELPWIREPSSGPLSPPHPEPALSTGVGIRKPCSLRRPEAEFRSRSPPPCSPTPANTPSGIQGRSQLLYSGPSSEKWPMAVSGARPRPLPLLAPANQLSQPPTLLPHWMAGIPGTCIAPLASQRLLCVTQGSSLCRNCDANCPALSGLPQSLETP